MGACNTDKGMHHWVLPRNPQRGMVGEVYILGFSYREMGWENWEVERVTEAMPIEGTESDRGHTQVGKGVGRMQMKAWGFGLEIWAESTGCVIVLVVSVTECSICLGDGLLSTPVVSIINR